MSYGGMFVPVCRRYGKKYFFSYTPRRHIINILNDDIKSGGIVPVFKHGLLYQDKIAVHDKNGDLSYNDLFISAKRLSATIRYKLENQIQKPIAYLCPGDSSDIITQWAIWMSGNIAVPLSPHHPTPTIEYFLRDSGTSLIICDKNLVSNLPSQDQNGKSIIILSESSKLNDTLDEADVFNDIPSGKFYADNDALIIYTSGTTSKPKGVVYGFKQIDAQIKSLHTAWNYKSTDVMLHTLPLHHVHGLINSVAASLSAGATLHMLPKFDPSFVWKYLLGMNKKSDHKVTVFMGVPTMYTKLINEYDKVFSKNNRQRDYIRNYLSLKMRLMISGSAPLPNPVFERWEDISGHRLLERYGMTEIGMALSNPLKPMNARTPGFVGTTLPGVSARISSNENTVLVTLESAAPSLFIDLEKYNFTDKSQSKNLFTEKITKLDSCNECKIIYGTDKNKSSSISGELQVRGPNVFTKYWQRPEQTKSEFTPDGWFKTGDTALFENGMVKILGRSSVDIIKSGGYKISALEIETLILGHESIGDCAVLGLPDITWGEKIAAVVELKNDKTLTLKELQEWSVEFIPKYQIPTELYIVTKLTRNAMGKVNKKELQKSVLKGQQ